MQTKRPSCSTQAPTNGALGGINLYPGQFGAEAFVEFDSMINLRPSQGNRSRSVDDAATRTIIHDIVATLVQADA